MPTILFLATRWHTAFIYPGGQAASPGVMSLPAAGASGSLRSIPATQHRMVFLNEQEKPSARENISLGIFSTRNEINLTFSNNFWEQNGRSGSLEWRPGTPSWKPVAVLNWAGCQYVCALVRAVCRCNKQHDTLPRISL